MPLADISAIPAPAEGFGNWYANLLKIERKKCLFLTNERTLYSFLIPAVVKADLKQFHRLFLNHLLLNLQYEEIQPEIINQVKDEYREIGFAKTASKSILGSMNDMAFHYEYHVSYEGGLANIKLLDLNHRLNKTPMGAIKYRYPIDALKSFLHV